MRWQIQFAVESLLDAGRADDMIVDAIGEMYQKNHVLLRVTISRTLHVLGSFPRGRQPGRELTVTVNPAKTQVARQSEDAVFALAARLREVFGQSLVCTHAVPCHVYTQMSQIEVPLDV